jgi:hypothetical protein
MYFNKRALSAIPNTLSQARFSKYRSLSNDTREAIKLYQWNLELSSSYIIPLHFFEIVVRNAIQEGVSAVYSNDWHINGRFTQALTQKNIQRLSSAKNSAQSKTGLADPPVGSVVAELTLVFWEGLMASALGPIIWDQHLNTVFKNSPNILHTSIKRSIIKTTIQNVRLLRNRVAHFEPIIDPDKFNHTQLIADIEKVVRWRCLDTASWLAERNKVISKLNKRP